MAFSSLGNLPQVRILQQRVEPAFWFQCVQADRIRRQPSIVIKDGHAQQRQVQLGQSASDLIEVKSGVAADERVATSNVDQLSDGVAVRQ